MQSDQKMTIDSVNVSIQDLELAINLQNVETILLRDEISFLPERRFLKEEFPWVI